MNAVATNPKRKRGAAAQSNGHPLPFRTARLAELPGIAERGPVRGGLHLASLGTINDVLALGKDRHAVFDALTQRNFSTLDAETILNAIEQRWKQVHNYAVVKSGLVTPWGKADPAESNSNGQAGQEADPAEASAFLALTFDKLLAGKKDLRAKVKQAGLRTVRELFDCAGTPNLDWNDDARIACFRWLTSHGLSAGIPGGRVRGEAVEVLDAIAKAAPHDPPVKDSEAAPQDPAPAAAPVDRAAADPAAPAAVGYTLPPDDEATVSRTETAASPAAEERDIPIDLIDRDPNQPRKTFDKAKLEELADSIREKGVLQRILVRKQKRPAGGKLAKHGVVEVTGRYDLIFGERRYRAAQLAGLEKIPARIVDYSDKEVLEVQVIENEQRDDVPPLEKADGYARLIHEHGYTAQDLARKIGKSTGTIYNLLKLRDLPKEALKALAAGDLPASTCQLIARIPDPKARAEAAKEILEGGRFYGGGDGPMSFRQAKEFIEQEHMVQLKGAPFDRTALDLVPGAGACTACPKMTGNQRDLYPDARADVCTDPGCYKQKVQAHNDSRLATYRAAGMTILEGTAAARARYSPDYIRLEDKCWEDKKHRAYKTILAKALEAGELPIKALIGSDDEVMQIVPRAAAERVLHKAGILKSRATTGSSHTAGLKKQRAADQLRAETARLALEKIVGRLEQGLVEQDARELRALVVATWGEIWHDTRKLILRRRGVNLKKEAVHGRFNDMDKAFKDLLAPMTAPQLLGLWGELVTTKTLAHPYGADNDRKSLLAAFGLDWKQLTRQAQTQKKGK